RVLARGDRRRLEIGLEEDASAADGQQRLTPRTDRPLMTWRTAAQDRTLVGDDFLAAHFLLTSMAEDTFTAIALASSVMLPAALSVRSAAECSDALPF